MAYYPKEVYSIREDVTIENKRKYDERLDQYYREKQQIEQIKKRRLSFYERYELRKKYQV